MAARDELNITPITQILKLLANLRPDVLVAGIEIAEMPLEPIDFFQREITLAERLDALHHVKEPAARLQRFASQEERLLPFLKNQILGPNDATLDDVNLA